VIHIGVKRVADIVGNVHFDAADSVDKVDKRLKIDGNIIMDANAEIVLYRLHGKLRPKVRLAQFTEYQRRVDPLELVVARDLDIQVAWNAEDTDAVFRWIETDQHDSIRPKGQTGFAGATVKAHHQHR